MDPTNFLNAFLESKRIPKNQYDDLKIVLEKLIQEKTSTEVMRKVLKWFRMLQSLEIVGWRPQHVTKKIVELLIKSENQPIQLYALFCPSYKKGTNEFGFRTDDIGNTTRVGIKNLGRLHKNTIKNGFNCVKPVAIFFDLALEQAERIIKAKKLTGLEVNIKNLQKVLPTEIDFIRLSELFPHLREAIGHEGTVTEPLPIPSKTFNRIVERGKKFYELFGWTDEQVLNRSKIIASSEALAGLELKKKYPSGIMVYTPTMLERAVVYSGMTYTTDPLPVIFPQRS